MIDVLRALLLFFAVVIFSSLQAFTQVRSLDSLKSIVSSLDGKPKVDALNDITKGLMYTSPDEAFGYSEEVLALSHRIGYDSAKSYAWVYQGIMHNNRAEYQQADSVLNMAVATAEEIDFKWGIAYGNICLGVKSILLDEYDNALHYFLISLRTARLMSSPDVETTCLMNLGSVQLLIKDYKEAQKYYSQALELAEAQDAVPRIRLGEILGNLGIVSFENKDYGSTLKFYQRSLQIFKEYDQKAQIANTYLNMGQAHHALGDYSSAMDVYRQSEDIFNDLQSPFGWSAVYREMGKTLIAQGKYELAISVLGQAIQTPELLKDEHLSTAFLLLSEANEAISKPDLALSYYKQHVQYKDSLDEKVNEKALAELTSEFEIVKLEKEKAIAEQLNEIQKLELRQRNLAIILISIVSLMVVLWLIANRKKLRTQLLISQKDQALAEKEMEIRKGVFNLEKEKLVAYADELMQKNNSLEEKRVALEQINDEDTPDVTDLLKKLRIAIAEHKDWAAFQIYFDTVYKDFYQSMESQFRLEFTQYEKRLMALVKIEMSNKEIADILNISRNSVVRSKSRLRDKMSFEETRQLEQFLQGL
ncbi:MAG: tetratricopeptide repeat protein [Cyclobacteriaceae bacterium]